MPLINGIFEPIIYPSEKHARVMTDHSRRWRFRALWGGRSGGKDWTIAATTIEMAIRKPARFLFTREVQNSIRESSHRLLCDTIARLNYSQYFTILRDEIRCNINGSLFLFRGLNDMSVDNLKSMEKIDICVLCEAQSVTKESFIILEPIIRKHGSEIWFQFNPKYEDDFVYQFCVVNPPENMIVEKVNYTDNPYNSNEVLEQTARMKSVDPQLYNHVWLGELSTVGGLVYPQFDKKVHVRKLDFASLIERGACAFMAIDPHTVYYPAIVWGLMLPDYGRDLWYIYNEFPTADYFDGKLYCDIRKDTPCTLDLPALAAVMKMMDCTLPEAQYRDVYVRARGVDTRFARASGAASWSTDTMGLVREWAKPDNGSINLFQPDTKYIDVQRDRMRNLLKFNPDLPTSTINDASFFVAPHCTNVINSLALHRFVMSNERECEKHKDFCDAIRIMLATAQLIGHDNKNKKTEFVLKKDKIIQQYTLNGMG